MSYKVYPTNNPDAMTLTVEEESGGSDLPDPSEADNGDVLTVVEGEWAAAKPAAPQKIVIPMDLIYNWSNNNMTAILRESEMTATELLNVIYDNCYPIDETTDTTAAIFSPDNLIVRYYLNFYNGADGSWAPSTMDLPMPGESTTSIQGDYVEVKPDLICCGEGSDTVVKILSTFHMDVDPQSYASSAGDYVLVTTTAATAMHLDVDYDESNNFTAAITSCSTKFRVTEIDNSGVVTPYAHDVISITYPLDSD